MPDERRHVEFFGPDFARGPNISGSPQTAAIQMAMMLAQLRAPLLRADTDIEAHADFVRALADRLFPDWAAAIKLDVEPYSAGTIPMSIRGPVGAYNLLECWLADTDGGGVSGTTPTSVSWSVGTVVQEIVTRRHYRILTPSTGIAHVSVTYSSPKFWRWAVARAGRAYYSTTLAFL